MRKVWKAGIVIALAVAVGVVIATRPRAEPVAPLGVAALPRVVEIGSDICVPCRMMAPVMKDLRERYADEFQAVVIDIRTDPDSRERYNLETIPTQVFFDATGKERLRHIGFMSENEILAAWKTLGADVGPASAFARTSRVPAIFEALNRAIKGGPALALAAAFLWGIGTVLLSPCHLTSIPLVVAFVNGQGRITTGRAAIVSTLFALGILATVAAIGAATAALGTIWGDIGTWGNYVVAALLLLVGLNLLDVLPMPWAGSLQPGLRRKGLLAAFVLGVLLGLALGPCTFAFMAPVLAATFEVARTSLPYAALLLLAYAAGRSLVIIAAGTCTGLVEEFLKWDERSRGTIILRATCGTLILVAGLYLLRIA